MSPSRLVGIASTWLVIPFLLLIGWTFSHVFMEGMTTPQTWDLWIDRNFFNQGATFWFWIAGCMIISGCICFKLDGITTATDIVGLVGVGLGIAVLAFPFFSAVWDDDKDQARFTNRATVFHVADLDNYPDSLERLLRNATIANDGACDRRGNHDVPSCINQGALPFNGWEARVASFTGARYFMSRTSGESQKVKLRRDSLTYLAKTDNGDPGWSGIRDGSGIRQPLYSVVEWSGSEAVNECRFKDQYAIGRAIDGERKNSLPNLLAEKFPSLVYSKGDIWGYCKDGQPVVVIPVTRQAHFKSRTMLEPAGVIEVRGNNGQTGFTYRPIIKAGELPGPVYPLSMVENQRENTKWAAGREFMKRNNFGFEPTDSEAQGGNVSEYLLKSEEDGRLYWVSPLTPRGSDSQLFVAYAVTRADEVARGSLNRLDIYVLASDDPRRINLDDLESRALQYLQQTSPGFLSGKGKLVEFTPVKDDIWRAYGEIKGRVSFLLDISASNRVRPRLVNLDNAFANEEPSADPGEDNPNAGSACAEDLTQLTQLELTACLRQISDELDNRQLQPAA